MPAASEEAGTTHVIQYGRRASGQWRKTDDLTPVIQAHTEHKASEASRGRRRDAGHGAAPSSRHGELARNASPGGEPHAPPHAQPATQLSKAGYRSEQARLEAQLAREREEQRQIAAQIEELQRVQEQEQQEFQRNFRPTRSFQAGASSTPPQAPKPPVPPESRSPITRLARPPLARRDAGSPQPPQPPQHEEQHGGGLRRLEPSAAAMEAEAAKLERRSKAIEQRLWEQRQWEQIQGQQKQWQRGFTPPEVPAVAPPRGRPRATLKDGATGHSIPRAVDDTRGELAQPAPSGGRAGGRAGGAVSPAPSPSISPSKAAAPTPPPWLGAAALANPYPSPRAALTNPRPGDRLTAPPPGEADPVKTFLNSRLVREDPNQFDLSLAHAYRGRTQGSTVEALMTG